MLREALLLSDLYIHLPLADADARLPLFLEHNWQPEFALQTGDLDRMNSAQVTALRQALAAQDLGCTVHAPFFDLNPASSDPDILRITARRFEQTLDFAAELGATRVVFHPGYDRWRYARAPETWLNNSLEFWPPLIDRAAKYQLPLCLENIFDVQPAPLLDLLRAIDSPWLRHCFDIGHWHLFSSTPIETWLEMFSPYLTHLHLHDNRGHNDDHRPIGSGRIDFAAFFAALTALRIRPTATLEAHSQKDAKRSLANLHNKFLV